MSGSSSTISTVGGNAPARTSASDVVKGTGPICQLLHGHARLPIFGRANHATVSPKALAATAQTFASVSHSGTGSRCPQCLLPGSQSDQPIPPRRRTDAVHLVEGIREVRDALEPH